MNMDRFRGEPPAPVELRADEYQCPRCQCDLDYGEEPLICPECGDEWWVETLAVWRRYGDKR